MSPPERHAYRERLKTRANDGYGEDGALPFAIRSDRGSDDGWVEAQRHFALPCRNRRAPPFDTGCDRK
jgi:hypothetical protein